MMFELLLDVMDRFLNLQPEPSNINLFGYLFSEKNLVTPIIHSVRNCTNHTVPLRDGSFLGGACPGTSCQVYDRTVPPGTFRKKNLVTPIIHSVRNCTNHTVPYGTGSLGVGVVPGTSCQGYDRGRPPGTFRSGLLARIRTSKEFRIRDVGFPISRRYKSITNVALRLGATD